MSKKKILFVSLSICIIAALITTYCCNKIIINNAKGKLFSDAQTIPYNKIGLLLGTSKLGRTGYPNPYYEYRIQAATQLIKQGKIKYLIISGDNSTKDYNEPESMRADLIAAGIDSAIIYLDYAGFRTFDSVVRLKEIFGQGSVTFISQQFHNERAIYTAGKTGITAIGYNACDVKGKQSLRIRLREKLARVKVFLDFWSGKQPHFLGEKIIIPA